MDFTQVGIDIVLIGLILALSVVTSVVVKRTERRRPQPGHGILNRSENAFCSYHARYAGGTGRLGARLLSSL